MPTMVEYVYIFKENLPIKRRNDLEFLGETIVAEICQTNNKKIFFIVSYRYPNQKSEEFEAYFSSLNDIVEKVSMRDHLFSGKMTLTLGKDAL